MKLISLSLFALLLHCWLSCLSSFSSWGGAIGAAAPITHPQREKTNSTIKLRKGLTHSTKEIEFLFLAQLNQQTNSFIPARSS
eukprot:UN13149